MNEQITAAIAAAEGIARVAKQVLNEKQAANAFFCSVEPGGCEATPYVVAHRGVVIACAESVSRAREIADEINAFSIASRILVEEDGLSLARVQYLTRAGCRPRNEGQFFGLRVVPPQSCSAARDDQGRKHLNSEVFQLRAFFRTRKERGSRFATPSYDISVWGFIAPRTSPS